MLFPASIGRDGKKTRENLLTAIRASPGIHPAGLGKSLGLAWSTVRYHVRILQAHGLVAPGKTEREMQLFAADVGAEHRGMLAALRQNDTQNVLRRLVTNPSLGVPELSVELGVSQKVIRRHLLKLTGTGLARRAAQPKPLYTVGNEAEDALRRLEELRSQI